MAKYKRIRLRRDSRANWEASNPRLALGEIGIDMTELRLKAGNGIDRWNELSYLDKAVYDRLDRDSQAIADRITEILQRIADNRAELQNLIQNARSELAEDLAKLGASVNAEVQRLDSELDSAETALGGRMDSIEIQQASDSEAVAQAVENMTRAEAELNVRMDTIVGQTTEDTEILDARVDYEGQTYANLGENIRSTQSRLSSFANQIRDELQPQIDNASNALTAFIIEYSRNIDSNIDGLKAQRDIDIVDIERELTALSNAGYELVLALNDEFEHRRGDIEKLREAAKQSDESIRGNIDQLQRQIDIIANACMLAETGSEAAQSALKALIIGNSQETQYQLDTICRAVWNLAASVDEKVSEKTVAGLSEKIAQTDAHVSELEEALSKYEDKSPVNWSDAKKLQIPEPRLAIVNFSGISSMPTTKTDNAKAFMEFWDLQGNYFKKKILCSAQGNSSMNFVKKNVKLDMLNSPLDDNVWDDDDTFDLKIGSWVEQDGFHLKAYYTDFFRGIAVPSYKLWDEIMRFNGVMKDRPWKKALVDMDSISTATKGFDDIADMTLQLDTGALCHPDGFPCLVYLNGAFYGIFSWQIKKQRKNYHMDKSTAEHIHLDGNVNPQCFWNGVIDWTAFEIRNPSKLYTMSGAKYDGDAPQELIDSTSEYYNSGNKDHKRSAKVKKYVQDLAANFQTLKSLYAAYSTDPTDENLSAVKAKYEELFDVENMRDYMIFGDIIRNVDGLSKNWQWTTYDGLKWYVNAYDLDMSFGGHWLGTQIEPPLTGHVTTSRSIPPGYITRLYNSELEARYSELRNAGIISSENIMAKLLDWTDRIGESNFESEYKKWPDSPCNNDNIVDENYWELERDENGEPIKGNSSTYNEETEYYVDDECYYGISSVMGFYKFKCVQGCINKAPITTFRHRDSIYRVRKWIDEEIQNMDSLYHYQGKEDISGLTREMHAVQDNLELVNNILSQAVPDYPDAFIVSDAEVEEALERILGI